MNKDGYAEEDCDGLRVTNLKKIGQFFQHASSVTKQDGNYPFDNRIGFFRYTEIQLGSEAFKYIKRSYFSLSEVFLHANALLCFGDHHKL